MTIEERALEKYPVRVVQYDEFSTFDMNENKRQRYIEICKEQRSIDEVETEKVVLQAVNRTSEVMKDKAIQWGKQVLNKTMLRSLTYAMEE